MTDDLETLRARLREREQDAVAVRAYLGGCASEYDLLSAVRAAMAEQEAARRETLHRLAMAELRISETEDRERKLARKLIEVRATLDEERDKRRRAEAAAALALAKKEGA